MLRIGLVVIGLVVIASCGCRPKPDKEARCHDVVEHMRGVSTMPMRKADEAMFMGACKMWMDATIDCLLAAKNDEEIDRCKRAIQ